VIATNLATAIPAAHVLHAGALSATVPGRISPAHYARRLNPSRKGDTHDALNPLVVPRYDRLCGRRSPTSSPLLDR
jgi:hypothetical protein